MLENHVMYLVNCVKGGEPVLGFCTFGLYYCLWIEMVRITKKNAKMRFTDDLINSKCEDLTTKC